MREHASLSRCLARVKEDFATTAGFSALCNSLSDLSQREQLAYEASWLYDFLLNQAHDSVYHLSLLLCAHVLDVR
jgi:hypothetical protein